VALRQADHSSKESYQPSISVKLRNLIRKGQGPIWAAAPHKKKNNNQEGLNEQNMYRVLEGL
jgi:hypothetical protein